ncbi:MAG: hypothetical protein HC900_00260 [Methylacidiphilales bacterium]|nr:hypothetical protein [Candidatus Methylacidiphilales bacterium]
MDTLADYEAWKKDRQRASVGAAQVVLGGQDATPDQVAGDIKLSHDFARATGNPPPPRPLVAEYRNEFQRKVEEARNSTILSGSPILTEWLRTPDNAAIAKDDLQGLSGFETALKAAGSALQRGVLVIPQAGNQALAQGAAQRAADQPRGFGAILEDQTRGRLSPIADPGDLFLAGSRWLTSRLSGLISGDQQQTAAAFQQRAGEFARSASNIPMSPAAAARRDKMAGGAGLPVGDQFSKFLEDTAADPGGTLAFLTEVAIQSLPVMAAGVGTTLATRSPASGAAVMGASSYGVEAGTTPVEFFAEKGIDVATPEGARAALSDPQVWAEAVRRGHIRGAIIGVLDGLSGGIAGARLAASPAGNMLLQSLTQAATGALGEAAGQYYSGQDFNLADVLVAGLAEFATAPIEVGAAGYAKFADARRKAAAAEARQSLFQELSGQAVGSKLRERMPEAFRAFVERATADGPVENVYVPGEVFARYFQDLGADPFKLADELEGVSRDDLDVALGAGGDLRIPTATYAARLAGTEHDAALTPHLRFSPDHMTAAEAAEFNDKAQAALQEAWEEAERQRIEDDALRSHEQEIYDTMVSELRAAGRSTEVATTEATVWSAFYKAMAERNDLTIEEMMLRYPLPRVTGAIPEGMRFKAADDLSRILAEARAARKTVSRGPSLLEWLDGYGGVADPGGDLRAMDAETVRRGPGKKTLRLARPADLLNEGGKKHGADAVAAAAVEAGFFADSPVAVEYRAAMAEGRETPDLTPLLWDAIRKEMSGRKSFTADPKAEAAASRSQMLDEVEAYLNSLGLNLEASDAEIRAAIEADQARAAYGQERLAPEIVQNIRDLISFAKSAVRHVVRKVTLGEVSPALASTLKQAAGLDVSGYHHDVDADAMRHIMRKHGDSATEERRGQIAITDDDFVKIPTIIAGADYIVTGAKNTRGQDIVGYIKRMEDGAVLYLEEVRTGRKTLSTLSMRKYPAARDADLIAKTLPSNAQGDGGDVLKITPLQRNSRLFQDAGIRRGQIAFGPGGVSGDAVIRLFEAADLSTVLHESGHFFLRVMQDMADRGDAAALFDLARVTEWWRSNAADVIRDAKAAMPDVALTVEDVNAWADSGTTGDAMKDGAIDVGTQEQWARALETYFMEGKAPSQELQGPFRKFRAWLLEVYRRVKGQLGVKVSDDLRGVFDRMLATDDQIAAAQSRSGDGGPVFATADMLGLTPEQFDRFMKARAAAEADAEARVTAEVMAPLRRQREAWYREERAKVAEEVERQVNAMRVFRALEWLGNRRWLGEGGPADMPDARLSRAILVERYGDGILKTLPRGKFTVYASEGGVDPDVAAGWFGYQSGDEMIKALEAAPKRRAAIEAETDRVMNERHGDPLNDGSIEEIALQAVHGDRKGEWLAAELKALADVAGFSRQMTAREARAVARDTLDRSRVRDAMRAERFLAAERKAGEEAARLGAMLAREGLWMGAARRRVEVAARSAARGQGDPEAVAPAIERANTSTLRQNETVTRLIDAKRRQLLNHALYAEARKIADEVEKAENYVRRLNKASNRERIAGAGRRDNAQTDYLAAIDDILDRYDFRRVSGAAEARRGALAAFVERMRAEGRENELAIPDAVLAVAGRKPYKTVTIDELRGVIDSLKNIEHVAKRWDALIDRENKRNLDAAAGEVVAAFAANLPKREPGRVRTAGEAARDAGRRFLNLTLNTNTILRDIDGREDLGPVFRNMKSPIDAAVNRLIRRKQSAATDLEHLYSVYSRADRLAMAVRKHIPQIGMSLSKWEMISVALNCGNEGNYQRLTDTRMRGSFTPEQVRLILDTQIDERDARFVQSVWDYLDGFRSDIAERERRVTGVAPAWVDPMPVTIAGVDLKGGYYPIKYDARLGGLAADFEQQGIAEAIQAGRFGKAQTRNGHLKARGAAAVGSVDLDPMVFHKHVNQVIYDLEMSEPVANAWRLLHHGDVRNAFTEAGRAADFDALEVWLKDVAEGDTRPVDVVGRSAAVFKSNFTAAKLAFNLTTTIGQVSGLVQSIVVVGKRDFAVGVRQTFRPGVIDDIVSKSAFMSQRQTTFNKDVFDYASDPALGPLASRWGDFKRDVIAPASFWMMTKVQWHLVDVPTWLAGYNQGLRQFGGDEVAAVEHADNIVKRAQASGLFSDRSAIERGSLSSKSRQSAVVKLFTTLASYMFAKFNIAYERSRAAGAVFAEAGVSGRSFAEAISATIDMAFLFMVDALVIAAIKGKLPGQGDDDDEDDAAAWAKFLAKETAFNALATVPFVRDITSALDGFDAGGAYGAIMGDLAKPFVQAAQGEVDRAFVKSIINATGLATGLPATQTNRAVDAIWRAAEGQDVAPIEYVLGKR